MSKIDTVSVKVTKTVVRYDLEEYQNALIAQALKDARIDGSHPGLSSTVTTEGDEVVVELLVEEQEADVDVGPRPVMV